LKPFKISAVSYLNTKPLLFGLLQHPISERLDLQLDIPSNCARKLQRRDVDLALVPVAVIPQLESPRIVSDYCIGTVGAVKTVGIYANRPIEELQTIILDHHSRTSVELTKLLCRDHWQIDPRFEKGGPGYIDRIGETTGGLVIGDRTIGLEERFEFNYDLGAIWHEHTGLPFVFAAWVSNEEIDPNFLRAFNEALKMGLNQIPKLQLLLQSPHPNFDMQRYFTEHISYDLDRSKRIALKKFLNYLRSDLQPSLTESLVLSGIN
jgi:chorismate dehydratase